MHSEKSAISLWLRFARRTLGSLLIVRVRNSVRPNHLFDRNLDHEYIGMGVHQATISVAVMDTGGKLIMECLLETKAATVVEFIQGLQGLWR